MCIFGDRPISKNLLLHLTKLDDDVLEDAISELTITSFIYPDVSNSDGRLVTNYSMLSLTRGFIQHKLDEDKKIGLILHTRYYELKEQVEQIEKSRNLYIQSLLSLGVKNEDEKIAFTCVKTAKNFVKNEDFGRAEENFEKAIKVAPKFSYALSEYAKFEFERGHVQKSNELFESAINADPENYHSFLGYGIRLRKQNELKEAIDVLEKAMELNPDYLPIYNHLGRVYCFKEDFEKANELFEKAKKQEKYPNYQQLIPQTLKNTLRLPRHSLVSSLRRVSLLSNQKSKGVTLSLSKNTLKISSNNPELGDASEEIDVNYSGAELKIGFNAKYLLDVLNSFDDDDVNVEFNDNLSPGLIRPLNDTNYTCIVMPMRI